MRSTPDGLWNQTWHSAVLRAACILCLPPAPLSPPMLLYRDNEQVANADIRAMALVGRDALGRDLRRALQSRAAHHAQRTPATGHQSQQSASAHPAGEKPPSSGELWLLADAQEDVLVRLIGYDAARVAPLSPWDQTRASPPGYRCMILRSPPLVNWSSSPEPRWSKG